MTDIPMLIALTAADRADEPTASAVLRVDLEAVAVCLTPVTAVVVVRLGDACASGGD